MKSVWRSWFWNIVLAFCMLTMAGILTAVAVSQLQMPGDAAVAVGVGFGFAAALFWLATVRSLMLGVFIRPYGIVVRGLDRTTTANWKDIETVRIGGSTSGAASMANSTAPIVVLRKANDAAPRAIELNVLGGYGYRKSGPTLGERATAELNARLSRWRQGNSTKNE